MNKKIKIQFKKVISYSILSTVLFLIPFIVIIEQHWGKTLNSIDWVFISFFWVYSIWNAFHNYGNILVLKEDYPDIPNKLIIINKYFPYGAWIVNIIIYNKILNNIKTNQ